MPELPEVETTRRGLEPHLVGQQISGLSVRQPRLRRPVPLDLPGRLIGQSIHALQRRAKYLLIALDRGSILVHLGMSGSLRLVETAAPYRLHDHLELVLANGKRLRFHDPRRFGIFEWIPYSPEQALTEHPALCSLGPEPLAEGFDGDILWEASRRRRCAVKPLLMDGRVLVGVGNIYASEALFQAGIHPACPCDRIDLKAYRRLAEAIRLVLLAAIEQGGTTLRDFVGESGAPGYFAHSLMVYGRTGQPCKICGTPIERLRLGGRSSFYCPTCQAV